MQSAITAPRAFAFVSQMAKTVQILPKVPTIIIVVAALAAVFADVINGTLLPTDSAINLSPEATYRPPWPLEKSSLSHPLGTDRLGRDILSRMLTGARISLSMALAAISFATTVGSFLGLLAGYHGRWLGTFVARAVDVMLSFPYILVALVFASFIRPNFWMIVVILGLLTWPHFARLVRGEVLIVREREYVEAARAAGASSLRIIFRHILPNILHTILVLATLQIGWLILLEASLSFLGAGIPPPIPTWGSMVADGRDVMQPYWWIAVFPGIAIALVVLAFNGLGDWLRDYLDPRLRHLMRDRSPRRRTRTDFETERPALPRL